MSQPKGKRLVALMGGGDWNDASVLHLNVPVELDLVEARRFHERWYENEYLPALRQGTRPSYRSFAEFLLEECGAERADIEEFWDWE